MQIVEISECREDSGSRKTTMRALRVANAHLIFVAFEMHGATGKQEWKVFCAEVAGNSSKRIKITEQLNESNHSPCRRGGEVAALQNMYVVRSLT